MNARRFLRCIAALGLAAVLGACQQKNTADQATTSTSGIPAGIERFLLFPNPIESGGAFETDSDAYASAYYRAIDPNNDKDTLDKWKAQNGFGVGTGTEHLVIFKDDKDLGYGRRMTGRMNTDGTIAFFVENYNVTSGSSADYSSSLNVEAAIARDTRWHVGTNAIEWSSAPCVVGVDPANCDPNARFAKFYNFSAADGTRQKFVNLDGKGMKAMPGPCITCHGGRGDPLTPPDALNGGLPRFPLVENSVSRKRGDVQARMHGMNVASFGYSAQAGWTRAEQEAKLKDFNQWMACTYPTPVPGATVTGGWGTCTRPTAGANEWQGTAFELIEAWYGGAGMPQATFADSYVPAGWVGSQQALYTTVVAPYCRTCHILRGTANQNDIDFTTLGTATTGFQGYAQRIKTHVFDRGNMPLAYIVYYDFWRSSAPQQLAQYIDSVLGAGTATDAGGAALKPGRPIADPGPNRMVRTGANAVLNGESSLFASSYSWLQVGSNPAGLNATITNANSAIAIFDAPAPGDYILRLTVANGSASNFKDVTITVDDNFPDPLNIRFAQVKDVLQNVLHNGTTTCVSCHRSTAVVPPIPPVFYDSFDRDGVSGITATDDAWFVKAIRARANLTDIQASPLLRKPTGNSHFGGQLFNLSTPAGLRNYSLLYNWILAGMQPGGVAASALVNGGLSPTTLTFSGAPPYSPGIPLDGSASIGATSYLWSVVSGANGPTGAVPTITNPTSQSATLNVPNTGAYVVELLVNDGVSSDAAQRTITVNETAVVADFTPGAVGPPVNQSVSFSGNPLRGNITLTSTSSGSPASCQWEVTGPANATLDGVAVPATVVKSCGTPAILSVASGSVGGTYAVTLIATSSLGTSSAPVTHSLTVQSAGSGVVANAGSNSTNPVTFTNPLTFVPFPMAQVAPDPAGIPQAPAIALIGSASTGPGTLTYTWSVISQPSNATGAYAPTIANASAVSTTLTVRRAGVYTVQLFVSNGLPPGPSNTATRTITVQVAAGNTFTNMKSTFVSRGCTAAGCHQSGSSSPPSWVDETVLGLTLYQRVFARVSPPPTVPGDTAAGLANPATAQIVRCPAEGCAMNQQTGFHSSDTSSYTQFLNWIINGAQDD